MTLYIAGLPKEVTDSEVHALCSEHGRVLAVRLPRDRETHQPRGIAFVDMANLEQAKRAMLAIDGQIRFGRRRLSCREAEPRQPRALAGSR